ncbi:MAG: acyl-CoA thioesterase [Deltaproteobacteria bacterium]|nr:acyl-CoA thioesterase [Deltaproteobacteria bacterium]
MFSHRTSVRVIYGDTDNMGQAYYGNYFRWFEIGRSEMFRSLGLAYKAVEENGIFLPVSEAHCKYTTPAKYDDILVIETSLDNKIKAGLKFEYKIYDGDGQTLLAQGYTIHPCVNGEGKVVRPPRFIKDIIKKTINEQDSAQQISDKRNQRT